MNPPECSSPGFELFRAPEEVPAEVVVFRKQSEHRSETRQVGAVRVFWDAGPVVDVVGDGRVAGWQKERVRGQAMNGGSRKVAFKNAQADVSRN
jgi:hypothetical protein